MKLSEKDLEKRTREAKLKAKEKAWGEFFERIIREHWKEVAGELLAIWLLSWVASSIMARSSEIWGLIFLLILIYLRLGTISKDLRKGKRL